MIIDNVGRKASDLKNYNPRAIYTGAEYIRIVPTGLSTKKWPWTPEACTYPGMLPWLLRMT